MFFTNHNAKKCDAIRKKINELKENKKITKKENYFLLASLITSIDKYANTSSVYGAYLKKFKKSALKELELKPIHQNKKQNIKNKNYNKKIEYLDLDLDVVYLDPPYNHRQYSGNYSPLNYIAYYDENIKLKIKNELIEGYNKSNFSRKTNIIKTFEETIKKLKCNYIILSYNNEGLLKEDELKQILLTKGNVKLNKIIYKKFKANKKVKEKNTIEYLWLVDVNKKENKYCEEEINLI